MRRAARVAPALPALREGVIKKVSSPIPESKGGQKGLLDEGQDGREVGGGGGGEEGFRARDGGLTVCAARSVAGAKDGAAKASAEATRHDAATAAVTVMEEVVWVIWLSR